MTLYRIAALVRARAMLIVFGCVLALAAPGAFALTPPELRERLLKLDPSEPMGYFLLAEEIAAELEGDDARALARTLFALALEAEKKSKASPTLAPSVYLALASLARTDEERDSMLALAGPRRSAAAQLIQQASIDPTQRRVDPRLALAEALGEARAGNGREVKEILRDDAVRALFESMEPSLGDAGHQIHSAEATLACPGCKGRRQIRSLAPGEQGSTDPVYTACPICRGNPGPSLTSVQIASSLRAESVLLRAAHSNWSGQVWLDRGAPLEEPDDGESLAGSAFKPGAFYWHPSDAQPNDPFRGRWMNVSFEAFERRRHNPG